MTPLEVRSFREWVMKATDKDSGKLSAWLENRDVEFTFDLNPKPNPYMSINELKDIYLKWEAYYWKGARKWMIFFGVIATAFIVQVARIL